MVQSPDLTHVRRYRLEVSLIEIHYVHPARRLPDGRHHIRDHLTKNLNAERIVEIGHIHVSRYVELSGVHSVQFDPARNLLERLHSVSPGAFFGTPLAIGLASGLIRRFILEPSVP
jgi:hypothetical protein